MNKISEETDFETFIKKTLLPDSSSTKSEPQQQFVPAAIADLLAADEVAQSAKVEIRQLLDELKDKDRDLQLAAKIGQLLLENNSELTNEIKFIKETSCQSPVPMSQTSSGFNSPRVASTHDSRGQGIVNGPLPKTPRKFSPAVGLFVDHDYITQLEEENAQLLKQLNKIAHDTPQSSKTKSILHVENLERELRGLRQDYEDKCLECRDLIDRVRKIARNKPTPDHHPSQLVDKPEYHVNESMEEPENTVAIGIGVQTDPPQSLEVPFSQLALIKQTDLELENIKKQLIEYQTENQELKSQIQETGLRDRYMLTPSKSQRMTLASELKKAALDSHKSMVRTVGVECNLEELEKNATSMQVIVNNKTGEFTMLYLLGDLILAVVKCPFIVAHKVFKSMLKPSRKGGHSKKLLEQ